MAMRNSEIKFDFDPIRIEIFKHLFASIAEEMGAVLRKASFSPNIKERRDYSCAIFNFAGSMVAQAAHIPVHLGSMPLSVVSALTKYSQTGHTLNPGDTIILNDPFMGGTHLPDITLVTPVFNGLLNPTTFPELQQPFAFVASRAHHADVGGMTPGSMPIAREIFQEGLIIPPVKLVKSGEIDQDILDLILSNVRTPEERSGDLHAQIGANMRGVKLVNDLIQRYNPEEVQDYMQALIQYTERMTRHLISQLPDGKYSFEDFLDNDGINEDKISIKVTITIENDSAVVDFTGSAPQQQGSINAVYAITLSAVNYVFRSLIQLDVPNNSGCLIPIKVIAPPGCVVNALRPSAVAGGNVETSQRIVDVLLGALAIASPETIPAASQGTMNNLSIGGWDADRARFYTYYETIGGGTGAGDDTDGVSAIHSHMTNTLNTPIEAIEYSFPLRVNKYAIRKGSGGLGKHCGGDGIIREVEFLADAQVTLLTERRVTTPYGLIGGEPGKRGENKLIHDSEEIQLPGKGSFQVKAGDVLTISTPGGGGFGAKDL